MAPRPGPHTGQGLSTLWTCQPTAGKQASFPSGSLRVATSPQRPRPGPPPTNTPAPLPAPRPWPSSQAWPVPPWGPPGTPQCRLHPPISALPCAARMHGHHPTFLFSSSACLTCPSPRGACGPCCGPRCGSCTGLAQPTGLPPAHPRDSGNLPWAWAWRLRPTGAGGAGGASCRAWRAWGLGAVPPSSEAPQGRVLPQAPHPSTQASAWLGLSAQGQPGARGLSSGPGPRERVTRAEVRLGAGAPRA